MLSSECSAPSTNGTFLHYFIASNVQLVTLRTRLVPIGFLILDNVKTNESIIWECLEIIDNRLVKTGRKLNDIIVNIYNVLPSRHPKKRFICIKAKILLIKHNAHIRFL